MIPRLISFAVLALLASISFEFSAAWFLTPSYRSCSSLSYRHRILVNWACFGFSRDSDADIVDADFERVDSYSGDSETDLTPAESIETTFQDDKRNLFDLSLDADPRWKTTRIPFCRGDEYIDGKLAFTVELEGVQYGIAVPFDDPVAIIIQEKSKKGDEKDDIVITYVDPDKYDENGEYQELMEIMAAQVHKELGEDLMLRKTPKVLTISGGLNRITDNWEQELLGQPAPVEEFLKSVKLGEESMDDDISDFMAFMRQELGDEEFEKTMNEEISDDDRALMKYFEVPGLGDKKNDIAGMEALIKSMEDDLNKDSGVCAQAKEFVPDTGGFSLKLISFDFADGTKSYSLVKLLESYVLVGKYCKNEYTGVTSEDTEQEFQMRDIRFELLSADEERILIPKLESICQKDLAQAGLSFSNQNRNLMET